MIDYGALFAGELSRLKAEGDYRQFSERERHRDRRGRNTDHLRHQ